MNMKVFNSFGDGRLKKFLSDSFSFLFKVRVLKMREDLRKVGQDFRKMEIRYHS